MHAESVQKKSSYREEKSRVAEILIENGANPCIRDSDGETPLEKALKLRNCHVAIALAKFNCT